MPFEIALQFLHSFYVACLGKPLATKLMFELSIAGILFTSGFSL